jgi:hypothetical protein
MDMNRIKSGISVSQPFTSLAHSTEPSKDSIAVGVTPKVQSSVFIEPLAAMNTIRTTEIKLEDNTQAPSQPLQPSQPSQPSQMSKPVPSVQVSGPSGAPYPKVAPLASSEGIAVIAQNLAVGTSKGPSIPKPSSGGPDPNANVVDAPPKQAVGSANVPANAGQCPFSGPSSHQPITVPVRAEVGNRAVIMVGIPQQTPNLERSEVAAVS